MRKDSNKTNTTDMRSDNSITSANKNGERAKRSELLWDGAFYTSKLLLSLLL